MDFTPKISQHARTAGYSVYLLIGPGEIATCDPEYYQHEQRLFLDFYRKGLVGRKKSKVN